MLITYTEAQIREAWNARLRDDSDINELIYALKKLPRGNFVPNHEWADDDTITVKEIMDVTAETFGITVEELVGPSRRRPLVAARQICMYVVREMLPDTSFPAIAREFGDRDHTTVMHAVKKIKGLMDKRLPVYEQTTELMRRIRAGE